MTDVRREVVNYVARLMDYGKGASDPSLDAMTLGQIADEIIACVRGGDAL